MSKPKYFSGYNKSHALIIGINEYQNTSPLSYAVNDASTFVEVLTKQFGFAEDNIILLLDNEATHDNIYQRYMSYTMDGTNREDRLIVFYAGHGHTIRSRRNEVGFLIPHDGDPNDIATLIRWDDLTKNSEFIEAKHLLFIMDACYGGLAITRAVKPGSMRFLKDMLNRSARQVLTAGKADEVVADLGGPLADHSVFTGHLIEGLNGKASDNEGLLTANGLMTYVYQNVGRDPESNQTPHFGYFEGDGDMIFNAPQIKDDGDNHNKGNSVMVSVPAVLQDNFTEVEMSIVEEAKEYLSEEKYHIKLEELYMNLVKEFMSKTSDDFFLPQGKWSDKEFLTRLSDYEMYIDELLRIQSLLFYYGRGKQSNLYTRGIKRICDRIKPISGLNVWLNLRWYPALLLIYTGGISAIYSGDYEKLKVLFNETGPYEGDPSVGIQYNQQISSSLSELKDAFKTIPSYEKKYTPISEHLYKLLQPILDDIIHIGTDYEIYFDRFEMLLALDIAFQRDKEKRHFWGPVGRFGSKYNRPTAANPLHQLIKEAKKENRGWAPIKAGMFDGSIDTFIDVATKYGNIVSQLGWF